MLIVTLPVLAVHRILSLVINVDKDTTNLNKDVIGNAQMDFILITLLALANNAMLVVKFA